MVKRSGTRWLPVGLLAAAVMPAGGATTESAARDISDCVDIPQAEARLACFDRVARALTGETSGPTAQSEPGDRAAGPGTTSRTDPGPAIAPVESRAEAGRGPSEPAGAAAEHHPPREAGQPSRGQMFGARQPLHLESTIAGVRYREQQKMVFRLDNGQVWMQVTPRLLRIREGDDVVIESATVGGYLLRTATGTTTRVERLH